MQDTNIFIDKGNGIIRPIEWTELNQLKKDILWVFDENGNELQSSFFPNYSFTLPYWEYVTLTGNQYFSGDEKNFYREGALIIVLCMVAEFIDIPGGNQLLFGDNGVGYVLSSIRQFEPANEKQTTLKEIATLGLSIAASITPEGIAGNEDFEHPELENFYTKLPWVSETFINAYYKAKLKLSYA